MRVQFGPVAQLRRLVGEQPLQPQQQREVAAPLDRGLLGPSSSSFSAASSARRRAVPGASASGPSPSSRKGSRANFAARSMSALDGTAAGAATSLVLAMKAFGFRPRRNAETWARALRTRMPGVASTSPRRSHSGSQSQRTERTYCNQGIDESGTTARNRPGTGRDGGPGRRRLRLPPRRRLRRQAPRLRARRWPASPAPLAALHEQANRAAAGRRRRLRKADRRAARLPGRGQRLGLLVRALPLRVPHPAEALGHLRQTRRLPRRRQPGLRRRRPRPSSTRRRFPTPATPTRRGDRRRDRRQRSAFPTPPSTTAAASSSTSSRSPTPTTAELRADIERYALGEECESG